MSSNFGAGKVIFWVPTKAKNYGTNRAGYAALLKIYVYNPEYWQTVEKSDGPRPGFLAKTSQYVFAYSSWQDPPSDLQDVNFETNKVLASFKLTSDETAGWKTYRNEQYGYEFKYSADHTVYTDVDQKNEILIPAKSDSDRVAVAVIEAHLFCCEPVVLEIFVIKESIEPRAWMERNQSKYGLESIKSVSFAGQTGVEGKGRGSIDSVHKLIALRQDDHLLIVKEAMQNNLLDKILSTFKFTK